MITSPLLSKVCHSPLLTRLIHMSSSCWTSYRSFEISLEMGTIHWIGLQIQRSINPLLQKTFSLLWITF